MDVSLNFFESTILNKIKAESKAVLMIPIDVYVSLIYHCEQTEDYATCILLRDLEDRVVIKTLSDFFEEYERDYQKSQQKLLNP